MRLKTGTDVPEAAGAEVAGPEGEVAPPVLAPGQVRGFGAEAHELIALTPGLIAYNLGYLALSWGIALGAIALFWAFPAWYTFILAFVVVSSRQQALLNCEHECVHRKFLPGPRQNTIVGSFLCAGPVGSPFGAARARHLSHHRLVGSPDDPDHELHAGESKRTKRGLAWHFIGGIAGGYAGMVLMGPRAPRAAKSAGSPGLDLASLAICQLVIAAGLTLAFSWWVYPVLWLAPLATITAGSHLVRSFVEHAITDSESEGHGNRLITIRSNLVERGLISPYFMNYHAEHHLVPSVPAPRLKRLQERLAHRPDRPPVLVRSSYGEAIKRYASELPD